jgi:hypothetical protein
MQDLLCKSRLLFFFYLFNSFKFNSNQFQIKKFILRNFLTTIEKMKNIKISLVNKIKRAMKFPV